MARHESPREDLIRDARALVQRVELSIPSKNEPVVVGLRKSGDASLYFGEDPALHFNASGQFRRGFVDGRLLKAVEGRLISMERHRPGGEVQLRSRELNADASHQLLARCARLIGELLNALRAGQATITRTANDQAIACEAVAEWLERIPRSPIQVAERPNAG